ncbi:efflux RND transporter periplasmic adaptor subunit [Paradesulfitobacterium ferrireducens]|uniref:efflux RND transporter periplasmic adaptor subunit n=1 Tax=Paradesulfitobacterium ferrireducens TaxID=2816476 RepID=UPI001A90B3A6|nr:HlyD family efflux transporter periplasmic adaptor subunit [Paradesulfitobacterium ferrireducens]
MKRKWIILGVAAVVIVGGGFWGYSKLTAKPAAASAITGNARIGDVQKVITATGSVKYPELIPLTFQQGGKLVVLNAKVGDKVTQGQVLAQLETDSLQLNVNQARANLAIAQAKLKQTLGSADSSVYSTLATAQQNLSQATQNLATARQNADPGILNNNVSMAKQNLTQAGNDLAAAQQAGDAAQIQGAQGKLAQAQQNLTIAESELNGGAAQALAAAEAQYTAAQAKLREAQEQVTQYEQGQPSADVLSAQASVAQAESSLATAQTNLDNAIIKAPADGVITSVSVENNQNVDNKTAIMTLAADSGNFQVDTVIDQADIAQIQNGQKADITLDTAPNVHISGTVTSVDLQGTTTQNVTTYKAEIQLDQSSDLLRAGMNVNVGIVLAEAKNVLTIPSEAVRRIGERTMVLVPGAAPNGAGAGGAGVPSSGGNANRRGGQASGTQDQQGQQGQQRNTGAQSGAWSGAAAIPAGIEAHLVPVEIGLDDGTNAEVKSGLTDGQEIIVGVRSTSTTNTSRPASGLPGTGGGGQNSLGQFNRALR